MIVDVISDFEGLEELRADWDAVYAADPEAQFFLSWQWLADYLTVEPGTWIVLAARADDADSRYVGFLALRNRILFKEGHGFYNQFTLAGAEYSDYCGLLADPEFDAEIIKAFIKHINENVYWGDLTFHNLLISDRRRRLVTSPLSRVKSSLKSISYKMDDGIDHGICPYIPLPSSWDAYLETLSTNNRQKIRRFLRKLEASDTYRIEFSAGERVKPDIEALLELWKVKWRPFKGDNTETLAERNVKMLGLCAEHGTLLLPAFWHGDRLVAALAILVDEVKGALLFMITGRDETYTEVPAGYLLHAYMIRYAIERGFKEYDFLRGDEDYKYLFAHDERRLTAFSLATKTGRNISDQIHPSWVPQMLAITLGLENEGKLSHAESAYREILEVEADNALALYRFGVFKAKHGNHAEARRLLTRSVEADPGGDSAWLALAGSLQMLGETADALAACRRAVAVAPRNETAQTLLLKLVAAAKPGPRDWGLHPPVKLDGLTVPAQEPADALAILRRPPAREPLRRR